MWNLDDGRVLKGTGIRKGTKDQGNAPGYPPFNPNAVRIFGTRTPNCLFFTMLPERGYSLMLGFLRSGSSGLGPREVMVLQRRSNSEWTFLGHWVQGMVDSDEGVTDELPCPRRGSCSDRFRSPPAEGVSAGLVCMGFLLFACGCGDTAPGPSPSADRSLQDELAASIVSLRDPRRIRTEQIVGGLSCVWLNFLQVCYWGTLTTCP